MTVAGMLLSYGAAKDDYFNYVSMLLPGNGTNGAQNNTFLDSSTNNFTITRNGNTTQGTFTPYGDNWSYNSTANGNYLTVAQNTAFAFGTGNFTIEAWIFRTDAAAQRIIVDTRGAGGGAVGVMFYVTTQGYLTVFDGTGTVVGGSVATGTTNNVWSHVAVTRSGTTTTLWINGTSVATATDTRNYANGASGTYVGRQFGSTANDWIGYLSNVRIVKGTALYTTNFTPSTTPLTAVSGTSLLTCQSNRFIDNSGNNFTLTVTGTPSIQRFSPFSPSAAYSTTTIGGSGYFDGTGDNLVSASSATLGLGSGNFTIEGWFYRTATGDKYLLDYGPESSNRISIIVFSNILQVYDVGYKNSGLTVPLNQWNHFAYVRNGTTVTPYLNGVAGTTYTDSRNLSKTATWYVASDETNGANLSGYMTDVRVVVGTAVYTSTFTPPTAPLTAITNTQLLLSTTNAGIIDNAMCNDLETVGSAQISTAQSQFGGSSVIFNGTNAALTAPNSVNYDFSNGDFTVELWARFGAVASQNFLITEGTGINGSPLATCGWCINYTGGNLRFERYDGTTQTTYSFAWTPSTNVWYHIAVTRSGTSLRAFINGTQIGTTQTSSVSFNKINATDPLNIGYGFTANAAWYFNGYMDDIRITKGLARYTATFTVPSSAFPTS
jgi:hypothetical protein